MVGALYFVFLLLVVVLFACVAVLMYQAFQPAYLVDIAELRGLEPTVKRFYKKYVVDTVWAAYVARINDLIVANDVPRTLKTKEAQVAAAAKALADRVSQMSAAELFPMTEGYEDDVFTVRQLFAKVVEHVGGIVDLRR